MGKKKVAASEQTLEVRIDAMMGEAFFFFFFCPKFFYLNDFDFFSFGDPPFSPDPTCAELLLFGFSECRYF